MSAKAQTYSMLLDRFYSERRQTVLVNRQTYNVKIGHADEVVAALKEATEQFSSYKHALRIYTPETGSFDVVAVEWEYESLEEYDRLWTEWRATPEAAAFNEKWSDLIERGGTNEIWHLAERR